MDLVIQGTGTTIQVFGQFIKSINSSIEARVAAFLEFKIDRVYLWDNLNSHLAPLVAHTLYMGTLESSTDLHLYHVRHTNQSMGQLKTISMILHTSAS
jgi:hypothetical protein